MLVPVKLTDQREQFLAVLVQAHAAVFPVKQFDPIFLLHRIDDITDACLRIIQNIGSLLETASLHDL